MRVWLLLFVEAEPWPKPWPSPRRDHCGGGLGLSLMRWPRFLWPASCHSLLGSIFRSHCTVFPSLTVSKRPSSYSTFPPLIFRDDRKRTHSHIWKCLLSFQFILSPSTLKVFLCVFFSFLVWVFQQAIKRWERGWKLFPFFSNTEQDHWEKE